VPGLLGADLIGVAVFAAQGASAAVAKRLDLFGAAFGGFVAAFGGEILRDLVVGGGLARDPLAGEIPVVLRRDIYAVVALGGTVAAAILSRLGMAMPLPMGIAAGLIIR
jgi:uncharacterized membrane protein YeiH